MSKLLFVAATDNEIGILKEFCLANNVECEMLVTGVGMVNTAILLTKYLSENDRPELVVNAGIAGAFSKDLSIGSVVHVVSDRLSEFGAEDGVSLLPANEIGLVDKSAIEVETAKRLQGLKEVSGVTVNRVHGSSDSIQKVRNQFSPDVESMEGAAVALVCQSFDVPWIQIRAISNLVEQRNKDNWNIPLAIQNLNEVLINLLEELK